MNVFIVGGTGFLGYYSTLAFLKKGHTVSTIALPDIALGDWFPKDVEVTYGNVFEMQEDALTQLFKGFDVMVYAVGPDDRLVPKAPAYAFFRDRLVHACSKVVACARKAGVTKTVVLNSYFTYFDAIWPQKQLAQRHPYIKARVEQADRVKKEGQGKMDVVVLELPYIFGAMPGRVPLWKDVMIDLFLKFNPILFPSGGTNMIAVQNVGDAVVCAAEKGVDGKSYPIGDENKCFNWMIETMMDELSEVRKVINPPLGVLKGFNLLTRRKHKKEGKESGLDPVRLMEDIMCEDLYFDADKLSRNELGYGSGGLEASVRKTVRACYPDRF